MTGDNRHVVAKMECLSGGALLASGAAVRGQAGSSLHGLVIPSPFCGGMTLESSGEWEQRAPPRLGGASLWDLHDCCVVDYNCPACASCAPRPAGQLSCCEGAYFVGLQTLGKQRCIVTVVALVPSQAPSRERSVEFQLNAFECSAQPVTARHLFEVSDSINI